MNISASKANESLPSPDFYVNKSVACNPKKKQNKTIKTNLVKYIRGTLNYSLLKNAIM